MIDFKISMRRGTALNLLLGLMIVLVMCGGLQAQFRVCATGQHDNGGNLKASKQACESGDFNCIHIELSIDDYNALSVDDLRTNCDIVVYGFNSNDLLKCNPDPGKFFDCGSQDTLYTVHIEPFLSMGGGIIFENPSEWVDLYPGLEAVRVWPTNTDFCSLVFVDSVPGLTDGILDEMECVNNSRHTCFLNFHQKFLNWNPSLFPLMQSEGVRTLAGGGSEPDPDCDAGAVVGLYGEYPGGGRVVFMGPDNDFHGSRSDLGPSGDGSFRRAFNQYQFLLNQLNWVAPTNITISKVLTSGPDADANGEPDIAFEITPGLSVLYEFTITYEEPSGMPVVIEDRLSARWKVTGAVADGGTVEVEAEGMNGRGPTTIRWDHPGSPGLTLTVSAETKTHPRNFRALLDPHECGVFQLNEGARVFETDAGGEAIGSPLEVSNSICLAGLPDLNGGGVAADGTGDEDQDSVADWTEACVLMTSPCDPDSDGDTILDGLDNCPAVRNFRQEDVDGDGVGDLCDIAPLNPNL